MADDTDDDEITDQDVHRIEISDAVDRARATGALTADHVSDIRRILEPAQFARAKQKGLAT